MFGLQVYQCHHVDFVVMDQMTYEFPLHQIPSLFPFPLNPEHLTTLLPVYYAVYTMLRWPKHSPLRARIRESRWIMHTLHSRNSEKNTQAKLLRRQVVKSRVKNRQTYCECGAPLSGLKRHNCLFVLLSRSPGHAAPQSSAARGGDPVPGQR